MRPVEQVRCHVIAGHATHAARAPQRAATQCSADDCTMVGQRSCAARSRRHDARVTAPVANKFFPRFRHAE